MKNKNLSLKKMIHLGGYIRNPVLVQVVGICPVAAAATNMMNALSLSLIFALSLIFCEVISSLLLKKVPRFIRVVIYNIIGAAVVFPAMYFLEIRESGLLADLGIYLPLMAMSSFNCVHCEKFAVRNSVKASFYDSLASSVGYCSVLIFVGFIREILGAGEFFGMKIPFIRGINGLLMPFGGLLVIGVLSALHRLSIEKKYPKQAKKTEKLFSFDFSSDEEGTFRYALKSRFGKKPE